MNCDEEDLFGKAPLRPPSGTLDVRIEKLLAVAPRTRRSLRVWHLAAACAACATVAFLAGTFLRGQDRPVPDSGKVQYVIQIKGQDFNVFDWTQYPERMAPDSVLRKKQEALTSSENT
jgi:hypothetical protein